MDPVNGQDAGFLITGVALQFVGMKDLAQVHKTGMELLCQVADNLRVRIQVAILLVGVIGLLADDGRGNENQMDISVEELVDDGGIEFLEFVSIRAGSGHGLMPDVIDPYPDKDDIGMLGEYVV